MKKQILMGITAAALVGAVAVGGTLAFFTDTKAATNVVTFGDVKISLTENTSDASGEKGQVTSDGLQFSSIVPGDTLNKEPVVKNVGTNDAYVRVKVTFNSTYVTFTPNADWTKSGDYYYYKNKLAKDQTATLFNTVKIPTAVDNAAVASATDADKKIVVTAEAVQADNFAVAADGVWQDTVDVKAAN